MITTQVTPIIVGYDFSQQIKFVGLNGASIPGFDLTTASRITGAVRATISDGGSPLATMDTTASPPTIIVNDASSLTFKISAALTSEMDEIPRVLIDFARLDGAEWSLLPVQVLWPTLLPATTPP